jgi:hypothetical protein
MKDVRYYKEILQRLQMKRDRCHVLNKYFELGNKIIICKAKIRELENGGDKLRLV